MDNELFWSKVNKNAPGGCWLWTAGRSTNGYGQLNKDGTTYRAHRISYELLVGPIPPGLQLDHLCQKKGCVNPAHLEVVTASENILRAKRKPFCQRGHEMIPSNIYSYKGSQQCRKCRNQHQSEYRLRKTE